MNSNDSTQIFSKSSWPVKLYRDKILLDEVYLTKFIWTKHTGQNIPAKIYLTKNTEQRVSSENMPDNIYRTKYTRQNIPDKIYRTKYTGKKMPDKIYLVNCRVQTNTFICQKLLSFVVTECRMEGKNSSCISGTNSNFKSRQNRYLLYFKRLSKISFYSVAFSTVNNNFLL